MSETPLRSRFVMAGHVKTHYYETGENGPPLVLCHGGGPGSSGEAGFGPIMPALGERYRVIAPDSVGGFGDTDPYAPTPFGIQSRVDHLEDFLDALCLDRFILGGNSQGAWVAAKYAILHPHKVSKLILIGSGSILGSMGVPATPTEGMKTLAAYDGSREAMKRFLEVLIRDKSKITDELVEARQAAAHRPGAAEAFKAFGEGGRRLTDDLNMRLNYDMRHTLPNLDIPTLSLWGESDAFASSDDGRKLVPLLPKIKFHWIPDASHQCTNDQPEIGTKIILDFLAE